MTTPFLFVPVFSWPAAPGGKLHTYAAGGTVAQGTWTDAAGTNPNSNPVTLDANGTAVVRLTTGLAYHFVLKDSTDTTTLWDADNYQASYLVQSDIVTLLAADPIVRRTAIEISAGITPTNLAYPPGHVYRYGTNTTPGTTDMTTALNNSILAVGSGGTVIWPAGQYLTSAPILAENLTGLTIQAASGAGTTGTIIIGTHTGKAVLSLVGSNLCTVGPVVLKGSAGTKPKTGLLLGRSSGASAGNHNFYGINVQGSYSVAGVYNIASESNSWSGINILTTAAPLAALYMAGSDTQSIGGLTGSSMEDNKFFGGTIYNNDNTAGSTSVYLDCSIATGHIHFYGTFLLKNGGDSWIFIRIGGIDGQGTKFPISFHNCSGEIGAGAPSYGVHIRNATVTNPLVFAAFTLENCRFQTPATNNIFCDGTTGDVQLQGCNISTPYSLGVGGVPSVFQRVAQSNLNLQFETTITISQGFANVITYNGTAPTITTSGPTNMIYKPGGTVQLPILTTGWGTPTGIGVFSNFPGATATLPQCSQAIAQIVTDLKAAGLYGV